MELIPKPVHERSRERVLTDHEVSAIWSAAESIGYPFGPLIKVLLLTGCRRDEIAKLRRSDLRLQDSLFEMFGGRTKTENGIRIPLSKPALSVLEDIPVLESDFVFTTTLRTPVSGFSKVKEKLDTISGVHDWRLHDFRRTMVSAMADMCVDPVSADRCLNHQASSTMSTVLRVYQRSELLDQRRDALNLWADHREQVCR